MANMQLTNTPMPEQDPNVRNHNFEEVTLGYTAEMAVDEAKRCLQCKKPKCVEGCPVNIHIPEFIANLHQRAAGSVRPCLPAGDAVRGQVRARREGRAGRHRPS